MSAELLDWIKKELSNSSILNNSAEKCEKHLKQIQEELTQKVQPAIHSVLESFYIVRGIIKAQHALGGPTSIGALGLELTSLQDVIGRLKEMSALAELFFKDIS